MRRIDSFQEKSETVLIAGPGNSISQSFYSFHDNFAGIRILVFNPDLGGKQNYKIQIENDQKEIIREEIITGFNLGWNFELRYDFAPITGSKNKYYKFLLSTDSENEFEKDSLTLLNNNKLGLQDIDSKLMEKLDPIHKSYTAIAYTRTDNYKNGETYLSGFKLPGDLVFKTYYSINIKKYPIDAYNDFTTKMKADGGFFVFFTILLICLILLLFWSVKNRNSVQG